jgi:hypothetical protein
MNSVKISRVKSLTKSTSRAHGPAGRLAPFGPAPLLEGEDAAAYDELLTGISAAVKPADIFEDIWIHDIVGLQWELLRLRRLKVGLMSSTAHEGLTQVLLPLLDAVEEVDFEISAYARAKGLAVDWARRKPRAIKQVDRILASADLTMDAVMARTLFGHLDRIERIEHMIAMTEARRNAVLREIDRHRTTLAHALRRTVEQIEDGGYQVLDTQTPERTKAP